MSTGSSTTLLVAVRQNELSSGRTCTNMRALIISEAAKTTVNGNIATTDKIILCIAISPFLKISTFPTKHIIANTFFFSTEITA